MIDRVEYSELSPRILKQISSMEAEKASMLDTNVQALLIDKYESEGNATYFVSLSVYGAPEVGIKTASADEAVVALKWFRDNGYKSVSFKDSTYADSRNYTLQTDEDNPRKITLRCYFQTGVCQFVDEPVDGEFEEIAELPAMAAVPAHKRQVMKRVLKCGSTEIPTVA
jgi:hypothetical protein